MSDSLSPSNSDLIIDDEDLDSISVTMEDLSAAEAKCGLNSGGQVIARPGFLPQAEALKPAPAKTTFQFGTAVTKGVSKFTPGSKSKVSLADPRTKFKPSGFLSLDKSEDNKQSKSPAAPNQANNNVDLNFNIKRTVQNYTGASSFVKQLPVVPKPFTFGSVSPSSQIQARDSTKFMFGAASFSPQVSPTSPSAYEDGQEEELRKIMQMKANQEAKMNAEKEKMERIEKMIEMKKLEKQEEQMWKQQENMNWMVGNQDKQGIFDREQVTTRKEKELAEQEREIKKQTTMLLQMQQNMLMEKRNTEEERRKLEDQRKIMELQMSVKNLERLITAKQGQGSYQDQGCSYSRPIKERVGVKRGNVGEFSGRGLEGEEELRSQRKRRFMEGRSEEFDNQVEKASYQSYGIKGKKSKYRNAKLPDELVLTEFTDQGPVKKEDFREADRIKREVAKKEMEEYEDDLDRYEFEGELDPELVLTEFSENGPVKAGSVDITSTSGK